MIGFFFYNKLTNIELIQQITHNFEIYDGYIIIQKYDKENNVLEISDKSINNNTLLYGKIVILNMTVADVITKINKIKECILQNKTKYTLTTIWANKTSGEKYKTYIIY